MKYFLTIAFYAITICCFSQVNKAEKRTQEIQANKLIAPNLPNDALKDLLNSCSKNCLTGNQLLNGFAFRKFNLPFGFSNKDASEKFINAEHNEWMKDKIFILFYNSYEDWMQTNFLSLGVKPNNCKLLSKFLIDNIDVIKERDDEYENTQANNSISFIISEFPDEKPEFLYGDFYAKFIADSMQYPETALKEGIGGKVVVRFIIDTDGEPVNIETKEGQNIGYGIPEEAIRLIELMKWKPRKKDRRLINIRAEKTIIFRPKK